MQSRQTKRTADALLNITAAVDRIFSCGSFHIREFVLPMERGAQISITGEIIAYGNSGTFREDSYGLADALKSFPAMWNTSDSEIKKYIARRRFTVLCGDCDRCAAIAGSINELVRHGISKIIIAADTAAERNNITRALLMMRSSLSGIGVTEYRVDRYNIDQYKTAASVYGFLTSFSPEILVIGRDSFSRINNIMNRSFGDEAPSGLISRANPVVITSSESVESGRTLAKNVSIFNPAATIVFTGEVKRLRDAVIYRPADTTENKKLRINDEPEQLCLQ